MVICDQLYGQIKSTNNYCKRYYGKELIDTQRLNLEKFKENTITQANALAERIKKEYEGTKTDPTWDNQNMLNNINTSHKEWVLPFK